MAETADAPLKTLADEPLLAVEVFRSAPTTMRVAFRGELDVASAPQARHALAGESLGCGAVGVEVDVAALTFCDAAGLRVFEDAHHRRAENGTVLLLTDPRPLLVRVLELTGLTHLLGRGSEVIAG